MSKTSVRTKLTFNQSIILLIIGGLILFAASGYYWYKSVLTNPNRIISGMLDKSLQSSSVQRHVSQKSGNSSVDQSLYLSFTPKIISQSVTELKESNGAANTKVTTETIGTPNSDFVRYKSIDISGGKNNNVDKILNVWGKRESSSKDGASNAFLNDALLVAVPFGNLNKNERAEVKAEINKVNLYEFSKTETAFKNGRPVITYTIDLSPKSLVQVLSKYVEVTNVGTSADLDPANYEGAQKIQLQMQVDVLSRHLMSTEFVGSGRLETYEGYNLARKVDIPDKTIDINQLQKRLQVLEQQQ